MIIKVNHDCGGSKIIYDKEAENWEEIRSYFSKRLTKNYFFFGREYQYKDIKPRIIVEKLLLDENNNIPYDNKVYCFNGKAKMFAVDKDRGKPTKARNWYDLNWNKEDIYWNTKGDDSVIKKPALFDQMVRLSEKIAKDFIFIRDYNGILHSNRVLSYHDNFFHQILIRIIYSYKVYALFY